MNGLQCLCDVLLENPSWTIAHLVAYFNLKEHLNNSKVLVVIDEPDFSACMTPIQVCFINQSKSFDNNNTNDSQNVIVFLVLRYFF